MTELQFDYLDDTARTAELVITLYGNETLTINPQDTK